MTTSAPGVHYVIDTRASQFTVQAFADGLIKAVAHSPKIAIRDWTGKIQVPSGTLEDASLQVRLKAGALEVLDELRDDDRRLARLLAAYSPAEASRMLRMSRSTIYEGMHRIRIAFLGVGLLLVAVGGRDR